MHAVSASSRNSGRRARSVTGKPGVEALDDLPDPLLVGRVDVRVDQADGERLDARLDEVADDPLDLLLVDLDDGLAARPHPLHGLARVGERGGRVGLDHDDPAASRSRRLQARQVEDLGEPLGRDQPDPGALRLEHGVGGDRRAVEDVAEVADGDARLLADPADADEDALRRVGGRRRRLHPVLRARPFVTDQEEIRERPSTSTPSLNAIPLLRRQAP